MARFSDSFRRRIYFNFVWSLLGFGAIIVIGSIGYGLIGGARYSLLDALFMTVVTVTSIGYEEVIDLHHNPAGQIFTMAIAFAGVGLMSYFFSTVTAFIPNLKKIRKTGADASVSNGRKP